MKTALIWLVIVTCLSMSVYKIYRVYKEGTLQEAIRDEIH